MMAQVGLTNVNRLLRLAAALLCMASAGCSSDEYLFSSLEEGQANEIISLLQAKNISATKEDLGKQIYAVKVPEKSFPQAVQISYLWGFPNPETVKLSDLFVTSGIVPTPMEEKVHLTSGITDELTDTLSQIEGITDVRLHLSFPNIFGADLASSIAGGNRTVTISKAAAMIKFDENRVLLDTLLPRIKLLISDSVPHLDEEQVVVVTESLKPFSEDPINSGGLDAYYIGKIKIRYEDLTLLSLITIALLGVALMLALAIGYRIKSARKSESGG